MKGLLNMAQHADRLRAVTAPKPSADMDPDIDFAAIIRAVVIARRLREMSLAIHVSHSHLSSLGRGVRLQPSYSSGVKIIRWYAENMG